MNMAVPIAERSLTKLTVEDFALLHENGAFDDMSKVELLDGVMYTMSPQTSPHVRVKSRLAFRIQTVLVSLDNGLEALVEPTISILPHSAPEPDIVIADVSTLPRYIEAGAVRLAVEVAYTTLDTDLGFKRALYASGAIPEYWVVDIEGGAIHQFWSPEGEEYRETRRLELGARVICETINGLAVETGGLI